jgi:hypothetical protein
MVQLGFFDADKRLAAISAKGDPLEMIDRVVPFESFRAEIEGVVLTPAEDKKSNVGRKPIDVIVMFRMLVLQSLYWGPRIIATDRQAPRICPRMIPLCSRFDSVLFTPKMFRIASYGDYSRSPTIFPTSRSNIK